MAYLRLFGFLSSVLVLASCASGPPRTADSFSDPLDAVAGLQERIGSWDWSESAKFFDPELLKQRPGDPNEMWFWRVLPRSDVSVTVDWPLGEGDSFKTVSEGADSAEIELEHLYPHWEGDPRPAALLLRRIKERWWIVGFRPQG